jgi:hypothetical protein
VTDPIAELVAALRRDGRPPLAWVVRYAPDGERYPAAWAASRDAAAMVDVLGHAPTFAAFAAQAHRRLLLEQTTEAIFAVARGIAALAAGHAATFPPLAFDPAGRAALVQYLCAEAAPGVRAAVPEPPPLSELIARFERERSPA